MINSTTNFRVKQWNKLKLKANRDKEKLFLVEGFHLLNEANKTGLIKEVITTDKNTSFDVPTHLVNSDVMEFLSQMATPTKIIGICKQNVSQTITDKVLLIDEIHHPGNLGTIIRSAIAFNFHTIIVNNSVDIYNPKLIQATQGMIFHANIQKKLLSDVIPDLKNKNYQIIGTEVHKGEDIRSLKLQEKVAVLMGNEKKGASADLLSLCDVVTNIKMNEKCESLNVGVAAGIVLFCISGL